MYKMEQLNLIEIEIQFSMRTSTARHLKRTVCSIQD